MWKRVALCIFALAFIPGCRTPDGPRFPLPAQDISAPIPDGMVRVVFFNTSNHALYFESGHIRIQLDGSQIPTVWLDRYAQVYAEPGEHELLLEHLDILFWKGRYTVNLEMPEMFLEVFNSMTSTKYKRVDQLPPDFHSRFSPARDPSDW